MFIHLLHLEVLMFLVAVFIVIVNKAVVVIIIVFGCLFVLVDKIGVPINSIVFHCLLVAVLVGAGCSFVVVVVVCGAAVLDVVFVIAVAVAIAVSVMPSPTIIIFLLQCIAQSIFLLHKLLRAEGRASEKKVKKMRIADAYVTDRSDEGLNTKEIRRGPRSERRGWA